MAENQRILLTRRLLREGLLRILAVKDIGSVSVAELCREAGINRVTFYRHYGCPRDVLMSIGEELLAQIQSEVKDERLSTRQHLEKLCVFLDEHAELVRILLRNDSGEALEGVLMRLPGVFGPELRRLKSHFDEESFDLFIEMVAAGSNHLIRRWMLGGIKKTPQEMADFLYDVATYCWQEER